MRLIDADVIIARCETVEQNNELSATEANRLVWLKEMIKMMHTIDPVRHGEWVATDDPWFSACSVCGYIEYECVGSNYCPECGTKMDGGKDEESEE